jgi:hypothetical protein
MKRTKNLNLLVRRTDAPITHWPEFAETWLKEIGMIPQRPNQAMQRTASKPAICFLRICHRHFGCAAFSSGLAAADLMSREIA